MTTKIYQKYTGAEGATNARAQESINTARVLLRITPKKIQTMVKQSKLKVQAAIQGDTVRVTGAKRDDLQAAMALVRKEIADAPLSFTNFRD